MSQGQTKVEQPTEQDIVTVIDIGSNSIRLSAYGVPHDEAQLRASQDSEVLRPIGKNAAGKDLLFARTRVMPQRLFGKKVMAGLASYIEDDGALSEKGIQRAISTLDQLHSLSVGVSAAKEYAFATASLRNVTNTEQALKRIEDATGITIDVLSGEQEAMLGYESLFLEVKPISGLMADIGGGSAELAAFHDQKLQRLCSLPVGSLKLYDKHVDGLLPTVKEAKRIRKELRRLLDDDLKGWHPVDELYGMGGSARAFGKVMNLLGHEGSVFTTEELDWTIDDLCSGRPGAFRPLLKACPDRIHTLVPGMLVMSSVCKHFSIKDIVVTNASVRDGYIAMMLG